MTVEVAREGDMWIASATTIKSAMATPALERWKKWRTVDMVVDHLPTLVDLAKTSRKKARGWVADAPYLAGEGELNAADRGTLLHECLESWLTVDPETGKGGDTPVELNNYPQLWPLADQLSHFLSTHWPQVLAQELFVYRPDAGIGGRGDLWAIWQTVETIARYTDLKSREKDADSRGKPYRPFVDSHALQFVIYALATHALHGRIRQVAAPGDGRYYLVSPEEHSSAFAPPKVAGAGLLWLTPQRCELYKVRCDPELYDTAVALARVWRWLHIESKEALGQVLAATTYTEQIA